MFQGADALDKASLRAAWEAIAEGLGEVSVLVNAAGGNRADATLPPGADFCKLSIEAWQGVFDLNLLGGALLPCQVFGESMADRGRGSIINIASMAGMIPLSRVVAYSAAKAAVLNLTQFLAREWAAKGVRLAGECEPDLVLMDLQLPGIDGYEALRRIREEGRIDGVPVVAVTAFAMRADRERTAAAGFDGYLSKPISVRDLPTQVDGFLGDGGRSGG